MKIICTQNEFADLVRDCVECSRDRCCIDCWFRYNECEGIETNINVTIEIKEREII